jgi:hypothetical protein
MSPEPLEGLVERLEQTAAALRSGALDPERAAELDRVVRGDAAP